MKKFFVPVFVLLFPILSQAAGIQVSPSRMDFAVEVNKTESKELVVLNPTADVQIFEVYPDEFSEIIKANPASFVLEAGARKTVTVTVKPFTKGNTSRILSTNLSVVGKPFAEARLQANTGVKIPITITAAAKKIAARAESEPDSGISPELFYTIFL